jgi:hypothetical protein
MEMNFDLKSLAFTPAMEFKDHNISWKTLSVTLTHQFFPQSQKRDPIPTLN